jgi:tryptophan-rich sensory protein
MAIQLAPNALWSYLFFGLNPMLAGLEIIVLWLMIYDLLQFSKINKIAGYLLIPYLAWVSFIWC